MKEYKCIKICLKVEETEKMLNDLAKENWELVCSYAWCTGYLILVREKK